MNIKKCLGIIFFLCNQTFASNFTSEYGDLPNRSKQNIELHKLSNALLNIQAGINPPEHKDFFFTRAKVNLNEVNLGVLDYLTHEQMVGIETAVFSVSPDIFTPCIKEWQNLHSVTIQSVELGEKAFSDRGPLRALEKKQTLQHLSIMYGHLESFSFSYPSKQSAFSRLTSLNLAGNPIQVFPEHIFRIKSLKTLILSSTDIQDLPANIGDLKHLEMIDLDGTNVSVLPESLYSLTNLQFLNLQDTMIVELSESLGNLTKLKNFNFSGTGITKLPASVSLLTELEEIYLANLPFSFNAQAVDAFIAYGARYLLESKASIWMFSSDFGERMDDPFNLKKATHCDEEGLIYMDEESEDFENEDYGMQAHDFVQRVKNKLRLTT